MTKTKKMTKRDYFNTLLNLPEVQQNEALVGFINRELELLAKKNSSEKKPTAVQLVNESIKEEILEHLSLEPDRLFTISEMIKNIPCCADLTNQRVSALVRQLKDDGKVERVEEKRKAYFKIA